VDKSFTCNAGIGHQKAAWQNASGYYLILALLEFCIRVSENSFKPFYVFWIAALMSNFKL